MKVDQYVYNAMVGGMYATGNNCEERTVCKDNMDECEDCCETHIVKVQSFHFTLRQKPWNFCRSDIKQVCMKFHAEWFCIQKDLEDTCEREHEGYNIST